MCSKNNQNLRFSVCQVLRTRFGLTQCELARKTHVTPADVSEMENHIPHREWPDKFLRVSSFFGVPVDALLYNDFRFIPEGLALPELTYTPVPTDPDRLLGRQGEELALSMERQRVGELFPALSELVIPYFKLKGRYPGFDILTFDDMARPLCLEVKTSLPGTTGFCLTPNEKKAADSLIAAGCRYVVRCITDWGSEEQAVTDYPYGELEQTHDIKAAYYRVAPKPKGREQLSGIAYYRMLRELRQEDLSRLTGIPQCDLSLYETGARRATVHTCKRLAEALDTTVQSLLATYDAPPRG